MLAKTAVKEKPMKADQFQQRLWLLAPLAAVVAALAAIVVLATRDMTLLAGSEAVPGNSSPPAPASATAPVNKPRLSTVAGLFGTLPITPEKTPVVAPPTRLDLVLKATFTHNEPNRSYALIGSKKGDTGTVTQGQEIAPGALLKAVHPGYVVISRNGQDETLHLPILGDNSERRSLASNGPQAPPSSVSERPVQATTQASPQQTSTAQTYRQSDSPPVNEQAELRRKKLMERLQSLRNRRD